MGVRPADVAIEREVEVVGGGPGDGEGHAEDGVRAELALVVGAVGIEQGAIDVALVEGVEPDDQRRGSDR